MNKIILSNGFWKVVIVLLAVYAFIDILIWIAYFNNSFYQKYLYNNLFHNLISEIGTILFFIVLLFLSLRITHIISIDKT